jgi:hypothetical protein
LLLKYYDYEDSDNDYDFTDDSARSGRSDDISITNSYDRTSTSTSDVYRIDGSESSSFTFLSTDSEDVPDLNVLKQQLKLFKNKKANLVKLKQQMYKRTGIFKEVRTSRT